MSALSQRTPVIVFLAAPGTFADSIIIGGRIQDMTGATVLFYMRPLTSRIPVINGDPASVIAPTDINGNNVSYAWGVITEGDYMAWWNFTLPGMNPQETPEFPVLITDHGPGTGTKTGAIVDGVVRYMPVTFKALQDDDRYGDLRMQQQAEVIKARVLNQTIAPDDEENLNFVLLDWLSKRLALDLTKAGIDYWSRQMKTIMSTQTSEVASYPDMIASLEKLRAALIPELTSEWRDLQIIVPGLPQRKVMAMPASSVGDPKNPSAGYITPNPLANPRLRTGGFEFGFEVGDWPFP